MIRMSESMDSKLEKNTSVLYYFETLEKMLSQEQHRKTLEEIVNSNFDECYSTLEVCLSVKAQGVIEGITLPFCLILLGNPSSYKTTMLNIVEALPNCYRSDSFTAKSFVSHSTNVKRKDLDKIDLLPKIKHKTLITPEMATIFSAKDEHLIEIFGMLTRILDGKGFQNDSGTHGHRGYEGDYYFTWLGASVEIPHKVWKVLGNLGSKMYFFRIRQDACSEEDKHLQIMNSLKNRLYDIRLHEAKEQAAKFWQCLLQLVDQDKNKIIWNFLKDDPKTKDKIVIMAQLLSKQRSTIPTWHTSQSSGSNYNFEHPIIENPDRAAHSLYNLARGHAVLYGRNFVTMDDFGVVIKVVLSSTSIERSELMRLLINNNGILNTNQLVEQGKVSRDTALKIMQQFTLIGLVNKTEESETTKPVVTIKLKPYFDWLLSDEFKQLYK